MKSRRFTARLFAVAVFLLPGFAAEPGMVFIPGGEYRRGRSHALPDDGLKWFPALLKDDRPVKAIKVDPFYLDATEVTNEQYEAFCKATRHKPPFYWIGGVPQAGAAKFPVVNVSWDEAQAYAKWAGKRLPTEAEWERAARGLAEGATYPWGDRAVTRKDARYNMVDGPGAVAQFPANAFGLFDVAGNAWEWCSDWYTRDYYEVAPADNPKGPDAGLYRVIRGGSWADVPKYLTCAYRSWARQAERSPNIGFRCAKDFAKRRSVR